MDADSSSKTAASDEATEAPRKHLADSEARDLEPWRRLAGQAADCRRQWQGLDRNFLRHRFVDLAKEKELSPAEVLMGTYLLFGGPEAQHLLAALMLCEMPAERLRQHNLYVGEQLGEAFMTQHGGTLVDLTVPLFPPTQEFGGLNHRILRLVACGSPSAGLRAARSTATFRGTHPVPLDRIFSGQQ